MEERVPIQTGSRCGPYVLLREVGRGGMATVFAAEHADLKKRVAIKVLHPARSGSVAGARFAREGRAIARLRHPHVVDVIDVGVADETPFLVMELIEGPTLATLFRRDAPLPLERLASLFLPVASAVHAAHVAGVIHRDLKPSNVLVATDMHGESRPVVVDFGISKIVDGSEDELTKEHAMVGTMAYMAPEQLRSSASVDDRTDQWALGVMLYEAATGVTPFTGDHAPATMRAILDSDPVPPSAHLQELPKTFDALVLRALHRDPEQRFSDVRALGAALLPFAKARDWTKWSREFTERAPTSQTIDDEVRTMPTDGAMVQTAPVVRRRGAVGVLAVSSVVTAIALAAFIRAPRPTIATAPASPASAIATASVATTTAPDASPSPAPVAPAPVASVAASVAVSTTIKPLPGNPVAATKTPVAASVSSVTSSLPPPAEAPPPPKKPSVGANGAPILE